MKLKKKNVSLFIYTSMLCTKPQQTPKEAPLIYDCYKKECQQRQLFLTNFDSKHTSICGLGQFCFQKMDKEGERKQNKTKQKKQNKTDLVAKFSNLKAIENQLIHGSVPEVMNELAPKEQGKGQ